MSSVDLLTFTNTKKKIPKNMLAEKTYPTRVKLTHIVMTHFLDLIMVYQATLITSFIYQISLKTLMVSDQLIEAYSGISFLTLTLATTPIITFSYYFFSFFFNHGQTWGMHSVKSRIKMQEHSFRDSFYWATKLTVMSLTGSFILMVIYPKFKNWAQKHFMPHDHLYGSLMTQTAASPIHLLKEIDLFHQIEAEDVTDYSRAA